MNLLDFIPVVGDIIGAGASVYNNSQTNAANERINERTIAAQKEMQATQNDWNLDMWNKNNEYNTASNQVQRLQEAGLNPAFYMGNGNASTSPAQSPVVGTPNQIAAQQNPNIGDIISRMGNDFYNAMLADSLIDKNYKDAGLSQVQAETEKKLQESKVEYQKILNSKTSSEQKQIDQNVNNLKASEAYTRSQTALTDEQKEYQSLLVSYLPMLNQKQLEELESKIVHNYSAAGLNSSQSAYYHSSLGLIREQIQTEKHKQSNLDKQGDLYDSSASLNKEESKSIAIDNKVRNATFKSEVYKANADNYVGTTFDLVASGIESGIGLRKLFTPSKTNSHKNPRSRSR